RVTVMLLNLIRTNLAHMAITQLYLSNRRLKYPQGKKSECVARQAHLQAHIYTWNTEHRKMVENRIHLKYLVYKGVTMNKGLIAILAGLTIVILLLANNNATVRDEKEEAKANIEDMEQEMQAMQNNQTVEQSQDKQEDKSEQFHTESKEAAINFINAYF